MGTQVKKKFWLLFAMSAFLAAPPVFAGHDHGSSHGSMDHGSSPSAPDDQGAKEDEMLINSCARQVEILDRRINKLQAEMAGKRAGSAVREGLKKLEQTLKEANYIIRPLQIY